MNKVKLIELTKNLTKDKDYEPYHLSRVMILLNKGLDVKYLLETSTDEQFNLVFNALQETPGINVGLFAKKDYSAEKMKIIQNALIKNINIEPILLSNPTIETESLLLLIELIQTEDNKTVFEFMSKIKNTNMGVDKLRLAYEAFSSNVNIDLFLDRNEYPIEYLKTFVYANRWGYDFEAIKEMQFVVSQLKEINYAMKELLDITPLLNRLLWSSQMRQIRLGLTQGISVEYYAKEDILENNMKEIRLNLKNRELNSQDAVLNKAYTLFTQMNSRL